MTHRTLRRGLLAGAGLLTAALLAAPQMAAAAAAPAGARPQVPAQARLTSAATRPAPYDEYITPSCSGGEYDYISTGDDTEVMDASGFGNPANMQINMANDGANQNWCAETLKDGYVAIFAHYATSGKGAANYMCLNVSGTTTPPAPRSSRTSATRWSP